MYNNIQQSILQPQNNNIQTRVAPSCIIQPHGVQSQFIQPQVVQPQFIQPQVVQPQVVQPQFIQSSIIHPYFISNQLLPMRILPYPIYFIEYPRNRPTQIRIDMNIKSNRKKRHNNNSSIPNVYISPFYI